MLDFRSTLPRGVRRLPHLLVFATLMLGAACAGSDEAPDAGANGGSSSTTGTDDPSSSGGGSADAGAGDAPNVGRDMSDGGGDMPGDDMPGGDMPDGGGTLDGGGAPPDGGSRFGAHTSCQVIRTPEGLGLDDRYTRFLNCSGIPVIGSDGVSDDALLATDAILEFVLGDITEIREVLLSHDPYFVVVADDETIAGVPEFAGQQVPQDGYAFYDDRRDLTLAAVRMSSVTCTGDDAILADNAVVHELAHLIHFAVLFETEPGFEAELRAAYQASVDSVWANTYAAVSYEEYWAEGVATWFNVNGDGPPGGDGSRNAVNTRVELEQADPTLYALVARYLHDREDIPGCVHSQRVVEETTCDASVDDVDGNSYPVVAVGDQCWTATNLKATRDQSGDVIAQVTDPAVWEVGESPAITFFDHDPNDADGYGALYNWAAVSAEPGPCPEGWHVPSIADWLRLLSQLGGAYQAGGKMKTTGTSEWLEPNAEATNESGLSVLPWGAYVYDGTMQFTELGASTRFWSSSEKDAAAGRMLQLFWSSGDAWVTSLPKSSGLYVRCVED